jgi:hypothetical protein
MNQIIFNEIQGIKAALAGAALKRNGKPAPAVFSRFSLADYSFGVNLFSPLFLLGWTLEKKARGKRHVIVSLCLSNKNEWLM